MLHFEGCYPSWAKEGKPCPYGSAIAIPLADLSFPSDSSFGTLLAVGFSAVPFFGILLNIFAIAIWRKRREVCWLIFCAYGSMLQFLLKYVFKQPRPRSCLTSCGMPSGHSLYALGMWTLLLHDFVLQRCPRPLPMRLLDRGVALGADETVAPGSPPLPKRQLIARTTALSMLLLPIPWARVQTGDHSVEQVFWGSVIGVFNGLLWALVLRPRCCVGDTITSFLDSVAVRVDNLRSAMWSMLSRRRADVAAT